MYKLLFFVLLIPFLAQSQELTEANSIHQFKVLTIDGKEFDFSCLEGQKILLVNTASKCMYAPQLKKMQELFVKYKNIGLVVIAFPSRDFYKRESKSNREIKNKYLQKYQITFPIMRLIHVKGDNIHPLFDFLSHKTLNGKLGAPPKWNFHKYLIDGNGFLFKTLPPSTSPFDDEIIDWIECN